MTAIDDPNDVGVHRSSTWRRPDVKWSLVMRLLEHSSRRSAVVRQLFTTGVVEPFFFLVVMGLGVGAFIDRNPDALGGIEYLAFIGPGLLATSAMQTGANEGLWPTAAQILWEGNYRSALTTPLTVDELVTGHVLWIGVRIFASSVLFSLVLAIFGVPSSLLALGAPFAAALVAVAFGAITTGFAATQKQDFLFPLVLRLGIMPMFLFSGAFFPVSNLPVVVAWVARLTPAWHGVELCRGLMLGDLDSLAFVHVGYLVLLTLVGWQWARGSFRKALAG